MRAVVVLSAPGGNHSKKTLHRWQEILREARVSIVQQIESGELDAAREAVRSLGAQGIEGIDWCDLVDELIPILASCLRAGEYAYVIDPYRGPSGVVVWLTVWRE